MSKDNTNFFKAKNDWSKIKDKLLGCYLTPYFQKVLVAPQRILCKRFSTKSRISRFQCAG